MVFQQIIEGVSARLQCTLSVFFPFKIEIAPDDKHYFGTETDYHVTNLVSHLVFELMLIKQKNSLIILL